MSKILQITKTWIYSVVLLINSLYLKIKEAISNLIIWIVKKIKIGFDYVLLKVMQIPFYLQEFIYFSKSGKSWLLFFVLIPLSFSFCNIKIQKFLSESLGLNFYNLLNLKINIKFAFELIDSSISVIATIFSIAFIIVGFLISNLRAYKEDTYDMIYRNIKLFPTLYISLITIGFLILISLFRHSFNHQTFINIVTWGFFLVIFILFLIGNLFSKVIEHIKPKNVYKYYFLEIKEIEKKIHHNFKIKKNSMRLNEMKVNLEEKLISASIKGDIDSLNHILSVYEEITKLDM